MKLIFKNFARYWYMVLPILILLIVQSYCDLSLPDYTSGIIDTGIANSGIEHAVPEYITETGYQTVSAFLTEEERNDWEEAYEYQEDKAYYRLRSSEEENWDRLDAKFSGVIAMVHMMTSQADSGNMQMLDPTGSDAANPEGEVFGDNAANPDGAGIGNVTSGQSIPNQGMLAAVRGEMETKLASLGDSMILSMAKAFAKAELEKCNIDITEIQSAYLWRTGGKMLVMALIMTVCAILVSFLAAKVAAGVGCELRKNVFSKVIGFSNAELDQYSTASLITRTTNDVQQIQMVTVMLLRMVLYAPILAIGGLINIRKYESGMGWIIVLAIVLVVCVIAVLMIVTMPKFKITQTLVDRVNLVSREILTGLPVIRAFSREKTEEKRFDVANEELTGVMLFTNRAMACMSPFMMMIMNGISVLIVWVASKKIDSGVLQVGSMTAFITYSMLIIMGFLMLTMVSIMLPRAAVAADRIREVLKTEDIITEKENAVAEKFEHATVEFDHVSFKYPDGEENVLEDISFIAKPGQTTAIIGSTGCGKSSLVKLIPRFFDVTEGSIKVGGVDVRDQKLASLRAQIGYVPQKGILFSGTIASNIKYGAPDISEEEMKEAARIAQAEEFVEEKPSKYESSISQGGNNVSGGQKQRLAIARAIARNPKIYVFDDSFSALDYKTDTQLRKALAEKTENATVIIVAQRVSTILSADQIIVLEDGKMIGKGTHKDLVESCETYCQIAQSQLSEAEFLRSIGKEAN